MLEWGGMRIGYAILVGAAIVAALLFPPTEARSLEEPDLRLADTGEWVVIPATVTAYTSSVDETDQDPTITASGSVAGPGTIACPAKYPFGTKVRIGGRMYECEDRMALRYRDTARFDIWIETKAEAYEWGVREVKVEIYQGA